MAIHKGAYIHEIAQRDNLLTDEYSVFNPYAYYFLNSEINDIYLMLQKSFSVLRQNKSKELVNLLTYLEDDLRKKEYENGVDSVCEYYYSVINEIKKEIGQNQLKLFRFAVRSQGETNNIENLVTDLVALIEKSMLKLNKLHKEWMRFKIKNKLR